MRDELFDTKEKQEAAISDFINLMNHPGWKHILDILGRNIEALVERLELGSADESKEDIDRIRDSLRLTREFRDTPQDMIKKLETPETVVPEEDPFETKEDLRASRKEASQRT